MNYFILTLWKILAFVAAISLFFFFKSGKNTFWGVLTIVGIISTVVLYIIDENPPDWHFALKYLIIGGLLGVVLRVVFELLSNRKKKK